METASSLTETLFGRRPDPEIWQDREIRFDVGAADLQCRKGEEVLDYLVRRLGEGSKGCFPPFAKSEHSRRFMTAAAQAVDGRGARGAAVA